MSELLRSYLQKIRQCSLPSMHKNLHHSFKNYFLFGRQTEESFNAVTLPCQTDNRIGSRTGKNPTPAIWSSSRMCVNSKEKLHINKWKWREKTQDNVIGTSRECDGQYPTSSKCHCRYKDHATECLGKEKTSIIQLKYNISNNRVLYGTETV